VSPEMAAVLGKCTALSLSKRYETVEQVSAGLIGESCDSERKVSDSEEGSVLKTGSLKMEEISRSD